VKSEWNGTGPIEEREGRERGKCMSEKRTILDSIDEPKSNVKTKGKIMAG
jgi:hypothetical protein